MYEVQVLMLKKKNSSDVSATIPKVESRFKTFSTSFFFLTKTHTEKEK